MKKCFKIIVVFTILLLAACSEEHLEEEGVGVVKGKVVQAETFVPLVNARVSSSPNSSVVYTDSSGNFIISNVKNGDYAFEARKDGFIAKFEGVTVGIDATTEVTFELEPAEEENFPPTIPVLTAPLDNATNQPLTVNLTWTCTDAESDPITYKITLRNDITNTIETFDNITTTSYTLQNLNYSTKYYWEVTASDDINPSVNSLTSSFRTLAFPDARFLFTKKIGFNNVIYTGNESGNQLQLTSEATNSFRPRKNMQANKIAFVRSIGGQAHLYSMNPDGSNVFQITNSVPIVGFNLDYYNYCWKSNGSQLIYSNFDKLYQINADGSGLQQIFQTPNGKFISECDWSNDGTLIALKVNDAMGYAVEIYIIDSSSGAVVNSVLSGLNGASGGLHLSVNNSKLVYTRDVSGYQNFDYRQLDTRIFMYDLALNTSLEVDVQRPAGFNDLDVRFSPNEAELIFVTTSNDGISPRIITKYAIGTIDSRTALFNGTTMPDWK